MLIRRAIKAALNSPSAAAAATAGLLACLPLSLGNAAGVSRDGTVLEEIIVTANKRSERLQDVAMSVCGIL